MANNLESMLQVFRNGTWTFKSFVEMKSILNSKTPFLVQGYINDAH